MLKYALLTAALMLPGVANANNWYALKDDNQCISSPYSPQKVIDIMKHNEMIFEPTVTKLTTGGSMVSLEDREHGRTIVMFTSLQDCKTLVKAMISSGDAVDPDLLK